MPKTIYELKEIKIKGLVRQYFASFDGKIYRWDGSSLIEIAGWLEHSRGGYPKRYYRVQLRMEQGYRKFYKHRLTCYAFYGPPKPGEQCRHLDDNEYNGFADNLAWGTSEENAEDKVRNNEEKKEEEDKVDFLDNVDKVPF